MLSLMLYFMMISLMAMLMMSIPLFMSVITKKWLEKESSFECGMTLSSSARKPFSIRFFLLMILFIIFDVEIAIIIIIPLLVLKITMLSMLFFLIFIMVLFKGLMYEWTEGSLNWKL